MAAVTKGTLTVAVGAQGFRGKKGKASADLLRGDPVVLDSAAAVDARFDCNVKKAASETHIHGIVAKDAKAGTLVEFITEGEVEGYSGLAVGTPLSVATGAIDSTAPGAGFPIQLVALTATRIWVKI